MIKIWRSWKSPFGEFSRDFEPANEEIWTAPEVYTDAELDRIRGEGFNAVWLHAQLNHLVRTAVFPELGEHAEKLQARLGILLERAARHGIAVYLYMQIPRGLPQEHPLWKNHPECAGQPDMYPDAGNKPVIMLPMCTSVSKTREYLREAAAGLARKLPRLAGVILITASEYPSHCYGRGGRVVADGAAWKSVPADCPRCTRRTAAEVIAEAIGLVAEGIHAVSPEIRVIAWNWSWTMFEESPCPNIIRRLPKDVKLLVDFERGGQRPDGLTVEEYCLGYAGPSERFRQTCLEAEAAGLKVLAKLQIGTTHELATVSSLPLLENIRRKARGLTDFKAEGFMGCWNFGNMPSANVAGFQYFLAHPEAFLEQFASEYFPGCKAASVAAAWRLFTGALAQYPCFNSWLYFGPVNFSPALPMTPGPPDGTPAGRSWIGELRRGEDITRAFRQCPPEKIADMLEPVLPEWDKGVRTLRDGLAGLQSKMALDEISAAEAAGLLFRSAYLTLRSYMLKRNWTPGAAGEWRQVAAAELEVLNRLLPLAEADSRIGYHIEAHAYLFTPEQIRGKIRSLKRSLGAVRNLTPAELMKEI